MIIIKGKIVSRDIDHYEYDEQMQRYMIRYKNGSKSYSYSGDKVLILKDVNPVDLNVFSFCYNGQILNFVKEAYEFFDGEKSYYYIINLDKSIIEEDDEHIRKVRRAARDVLDYMREVSKITSVNTDDGRKILHEQMRIVKDDDFDSALANYLNMSDNIFTGDNVSKCLIFPFGCNLYQFNAVKNAVFNKISVIEGPPGTGKTLTILNIAANIIIRGKNCQIVSNNNSAIENIQEKLRDNNLEFLSALLGNSENISNFIDDQSVGIPDMSFYDSFDIRDIERELKAKEELVKKFYQYKKDVASLMQSKREYELEYKYLKEYLHHEGIEIVDVKYKNISKLELMLSEMLVIDKLLIKDRIKFLFLYRVGDFKFYRNGFDVILNSIQNEFYASKIRNIELELAEKNEFIAKNINVKDEFINLSMNYFMKYLSLHYRSERKVYSLLDMQKDPLSFVHDYPVVLSTTYSSRKSLGDSFKFDYVIMDEASQIDVVSGTLALSSAKCAVIIGDEAQLPNVVTDGVRDSVDKIFNEYEIDKGYSYSLNSFLGSVKNVVDNIPCEMLREHYRCHPKIINFCNKKFYNDKLIIMSEDNGEDDVIKVIRTVKGNHVRDKTSQRQLDVIKELLPDIHEDDIGVIAPYNKQVNLIKEVLPDLDVSTVHKFQGREKDVIIITTVDDEISDFVANSNILNVAISRAKKKLIFIVTGNDIANRNFNDFIDYVEYNNLEIVHNKIYSVFDLLYAVNKDKKLKYLKGRVSKSRYDSENLLYYLLEDILVDYDSLSFHFQYKMKMLVRDKDSLEERERKFVDHNSSHVDFLVYRKIGEKPVLVIEADSYYYHKKGSKQYERDLMKDKILRDRGLEVMRLKSNGSMEEEQIREALDKLI